MSAITERMPAAFGEKRDIKLFDGRTVTAHSIVIDGKEVAEITKHDGFWHAIIHGSLYFGANANGETPAEAMAAALSAGVLRMAEALAKIRAVAVERGEELVALAEGLA